MLRIFAAAAVWLLSLAPSFAGWYQIELSNVGPYYSVPGPCYCWLQVYHSPVFSVNPGDIYDFGRLDFLPFAIDGGGAHQQIPPPTEYIFGRLEVVYNQTATADEFPGYIDSGTNPNALYSSRLIFDITPGENSIQLLWWGADYVTPTAAVPETSTWAMLLLGFAGIGVMAYRRKSSQASMGGLIHDHQIQIEEPPSGGFLLPVGDSQRGP